VPTQANAQAHLQEQDEAARAAAREIATLKESLAEALAAAANAREVESLRVSLAAEKQEKTAAKLEAAKLKDRVRRIPLSLGWALVFLLGLVVVLVFLHHGATSLAQLLRQADVPMLWGAGGAAGRSDQADAAGDEGARRPLAIAADAAASRLGLGLSWARCALLRV